MRIPFRDNRKDWKKVIGVMYEHQIVVDREVVESKSDLEKFHEGSSAIRHISGKSGISLSSVWDSIDYLIAVDLVEEIGDHPESKFGLTQEGLQLAHRIKTERQGRNTNIILLALTAVLTILTVVLVIAELSII